MPAGRALGLLAGLGTDALIGDPGNAWHPTAWFGRWAGWLEQRCYADSVAAGACFTVLAVAPVVALGVGAEALCRRRCWLRPAVTALATWAVVGARSLATQGRAMADRLDGGDLAGSRAQLGNLCGRLASELNEAELARATIESLAENTADSVVASLFWGAVAGIPGLLAHRAINTLDAMVGHRNDRYERFGKASARADDLLDWLPARITGALGALLGPQPAASWAVVRRDAGKHPSPNGGWCESAWAAALGVQLGGRNVYPGGRSEERGLLNAGAPAPDALAVRQASRLVSGVSLLAGGLAAAALLDLAGRARRP